MALELGSAADHLSVVSITLFTALLCVCVVIGHLLEERRWTNESITALAIGLLTGGVILWTTQGTSSRLLVFREDLFFTYWLPPIIFNAGFQVKKKQFFWNFSTIVLFGALGTLISFIIISVGTMLLFSMLDIGSLEVSDYLAIGAIFSATDTVCTLQVLHQDETPLLYSLVFGEGVVNDATSVVLFRAVQNFNLDYIDVVHLSWFIANFLYLFVTSTLLGIFAGLLSAYLIKNLYFGRHSTDREVALMSLLAYLSYTLAELLDLSGILTVFFCGILMSHYTWHNVTESSRVTTKHAFATFSFIAEIFIFLYVGMDALDIEKWKLAKDSPGTSIAVSSILLGLVMVGRAVFVFPLSFLSNLVKRSPYVEKVTFKQQVIIWWAGLMRGAVSVALAYNQFTSSGHTELRGNAIMITSTFTIVLFSTMVFGLMTKPIVRYLHPPTTGHFSSMSEPPTLSSVFLPLLSDAQGPDAEAARKTIPLTPSFRMLISRTTHTVHHYWHRMDDAFMHPVFGGRGFVPHVPGSPTERTAHHPLDGEAELSSNRGTG